MRSLLQRGGWFYVLAGAVLIGSVIWALLLPSDVVGHSGCEPVGAPCRLIYDHRSVQRFLIVSFGAFVAFVIWAFTYIGRHA